MKLPSPAPHQSPASSSSHRRRQHGEADLHPEKGLHECNDFAHKNQVSQAFCIFVLLAQLLYLIVLALLDLLLCASSPSPLRTKHEVSFFRVSMSCLCASLTRRGLVKIVKRMFVYVGTLVTESLRGLFTAILTWQNFGWTDQRGLLLDGVLAKHVECPESAD